MANKSYCKLMAQYHRLISLNLLYYVLNQFVQELEDVVDEKRAFVLEDLVSVVFEHKYCFFPYLNNRCSNVSIRFYAKVRLSTTPYLNKKKRRKKSGS